jgi:hypothetical protein
MRGANKGAKGLLPIIELPAIEDAMDVLPAEELRGDRRVRPNSEEAMVLLRRERREQLAFARGKRTVAHHGLREGEQVPHGVGAIRKETSEIRLSIGLGSGVDNLLQEHR